MGYNGLTNFGIEYQARMTAENKPVTLTKVRVGNGSIPASQTGATTTNLYSYKKEVEILAKEQVENAVKLQILLNNLDQEIGFYVKELGVYVQDGAEEKLYWYINKDNPSYLDDKNVPSKHRYNLFLEVTNVETIIINFTGQGLLADKKYVDDSIADFESGYNATINELRTSINSNLASGTLPTSLNSGEKIYKALQGNGGLKFDENLLYLNDSGVKKTGYYYLDRLTEGIFECIEQTETMVNNSSLFKNISNKANSDKLENLFKKQWKFLTEGVNIKTFSLPSDWEEIAFYQAEGKILGGSNNYQIVTVSYPRAFIEKYKIISTWQTAGNGYSDFESISYDYSDNTFTLKKVFTGGGSTPDNAYVIFYR